MMAEEGPRNTNSGRPEFASSTGTGTRSQGEQGDLKALVISNYAASSVRFVRNWITLGRLEEGPVLVRISPSRTAQDLSRGWARTTEELNLMGWFAPGQRSIFGGARSGLRRSRTEMIASTLTAGHFRMDLTGTTGEPVRIRWCAPGRHSTFGWVEQG